MTSRRDRVGIAGLDSLCERLIASGARLPSYVGPLARHVEDGDSRLVSLRYDESAAALRLWGFLLTEEERLLAARAAGGKLVGTMKDLGTVPVMAYALPGVTAFYPDGAWWIPCVMELSAGLLEVADSLGVGEQFCPVRAMLGAFVTKAHFPIPDLLTCSVGATCDDFSAIAQRLESLGHRILWWEIPSRRRADVGEPEVVLPGGFRAAASQVEFVRGELERVRGALEELALGRLGYDRALPPGPSNLSFMPADGLAGSRRSRRTVLTERRLRDGIAQANKVRRILAELRRLVFTAPACPLPALELLIAEMMAIHFCSDRAEVVLVLEELLAEVRRRVEAGTGVLREGAARVYWVNPVADLRAMNLLEDSGGRLCGTDFLFCHALDEIPEDLAPMEALARAALADPMIGPSSDRAARIVREARELGSEAVVVSRIPGASHCATEGAVIAEAVRTELGLPLVEIEVPPLADAMFPTLAGRLEALVETALGNRRA